MNFAMPSDSQDSEAPALEIHAESIATEMKARTKVDRNADHQTVLQLINTILIGLIFVVLLSWICSLYTLRTVNQLSFWTTDGWFVGWGWAALTSFALAWSVFNVHWARAALVELKVLESYVHWAVAICCGFAVLGLHYVSASRSSHEGPLIVDPDNRLPEATSQETLAGPIFGKVSRGKAWFSLTCVTCHGPTGDGIHNLAPSLRESEFLKTADARSINLLIRRGRDIRDPLNKSGKPMPARGGDLSITDEKIADLVAFVMSLHSRTADPDSLSWEGVESAPPSLSKQSLKTNPQNVDVRNTNLTVLAVHASYVAGLICSSLYLLFGWMRGWSNRRSRSWIYWNFLGWYFALATWLAVLLILGMVDIQFFDWLRS